MMSRGFSRGRPYLREFSRSITVHTDGACINNGQPGAKAGIGVHFPNGELQDKSEPLRGSRQTNQRAEIVAATAGINLARGAGYDDITVKLDSTYVKDAMDVWIHNWIKTNWRGNITNKQDFEGLHGSMEGINVYFEWIPRDLNGVADQLAKEGAKMGDHC